MLTQRWRPVLFSALAVGVIWGLALAGFAIARNARVTPEKVKAYVESRELSALAGEARANALKRLEDMLNSLSLEERQRARLDRVTAQWFAQMTEPEKSAFLEATLPTGFKQMLGAFEQLPEDRRRKSIDDAVRRLREGRAQPRAWGGPRGANPADTNAPPVLSEELQAQIRTIGLKTFYSQSSAETKAELAPVLEELQRLMENGRTFHSR